MKNIVEVLSNATTQFTTTLTQHNNENESISIASGSGRGIIRSVVANVSESLDFDVLFYKSSAFTGVPCGAVHFFTTDSLRVAGAGQYIYPKHDLFIPYNDESTDGTLATDTTPALHTQLINRDSDSKSGGVTGSMQLRISLEVQ